MSLRSEIISIGDELTSGQRLDTNSRWLSERLGDLGVKTVFHTTVGDSMADNIDAFRTATRRADIVIASGGLGPTADDLTREAISQAFDAPLEMRQEAMDHIASLFAKRQRPMPERNQVQAMFPMGSRIIDNPHGTAPGIDLVVRAAGKESRIFSLPGVPAEMMEMYRATVEKRLVDELGVGRQRWFYHSLKVFGIGESDVEKRLPDLIHRDRDPLVGNHGFQSDHHFAYRCVMAKRSQSFKTRSSLPSKLFAKNWGCWYSVKERSISTKPQTNCCASEDCDWV